MVCFRICGSTFVVLEGADGCALLRTPRLTGHLACRAAIASIRLVTLMDDHYHRYRTSDGAFAFAVRRPGAGVLAWSSAFPDETSRENAIEIVRRGAPSASVVQSPVGAFTIDPRTGLPQSGALPAAVPARSDADATTRSESDDPGDVSG
jgi:uncharacterized protein YegP (UPF0339 family)